MTTLTDGRRTLAGPPDRSPTTAPPAPIPFSRLVRVEWSKATDTRAARWLLGIIGVLTAGLVAIPLAMPNDFDQSLRAFLEMASIGMLVLLPVVTILTLTSEWSQHTAMTTFTQEPRRAWVVGAKLVVAILLGALGALASFVTSYGGLAIAELLGRTVEWGLPPWRVLVGFVLMSLLNALMGAAFGAVLHNTPAAIVLVFLLPTLWSVLSFGFFEDIGRWLDTSQSWSWLASGEWSGHGGPIVVSSLAWVALPLAAGMWRTVRREVK